MRGEVLKEKSFAYRGEMVHDICMGKMGSFSPNAGFVLSEPLKRLVDERVASGACGSAEEFIQRAVEEKLAREMLAAKVAEGLASGTAIVFDEEFTEKQKRFKWKKYQHR